MASAKRIIMGQDESLDWIPYINGTAYYAYVGGVKIPHWTASPAEPATKFSSQPSGSTGASGGYTANGYTIYCSTTYSASSYGAWRAFDGSWSNANGWASGSNDTSPWLMIKLKAPLKNVKVTIYNRTRSSLVNGPIAGTIYGLDSATGTATQIGSFSGRSGTTSAESSTVTCNNYSTAFQFIKIAFTNWTGKGNSSDNYCSVGEIILNGKIAT